MAKTKLKLVSAYVEPEIYQALVEWAEDEDRSLSNLVGRLLAKSVQEKNQAEDSQNENHQASWKLTYSQSGYRNNFYNHYLKTYKL